MTWVLAAAAAVFGAAVTWFLTANRDADRPQGSLSHVDGAEDPDDSSGFGGTPTAPSEVIGPAEAWMRDAEDEDALLARDGGDAEVAPTANIPPVRSATPAGDVAGVGEPETVATVEAQSEATAPTPDHESAEDPHSRG